MKYLGLAAAALVMTTGAYASTVTISCTTAPQTAIGQTTITSVAIVCPDFTAVPFALSYNSITISAEDSFSQANGTLTYAFNYSAIDPDFSFALGTSPNTCIAGSGVTSTSCTDSITGAVIAASVYPFAGTATDASSYIGGGSYTLATLNGSITSGNALSNFSAGSTYMETLNYTSAAPEPGSMLLLSGGLLAIGLIGRKKLVRK